VVQECEHELIVVHEARFHAECQRVIQERRMDDLARTYNLLSRTTHGLRPMLASFMECVTAVGLEALEALGETAIKVG